MADWIISHFPAHRTYVEPFGGAASVLMQKPRSYAEVYNDRWDAIVNVFRVLRDPEMAAELKRQLILTPYSRAEFEACSGAAGKPRSESQAQEGTGSGKGGRAVFQTEDCPPLALLKRVGDVEAARVTILRSISGFSSASANSDYPTGFRAYVNMESTPPARDWSHYPAHIARFTERLQGVLIENHDWRELIPMHDRADTLFYADPPYLQETRSEGFTDPYVHEMTRAEHAELADMLCQVKGMVVLSGYPSPLYKRWYEKEGWERREKTGLQNHNLPERTEVLWLNPAAVKASPQTRLFG